MSEFKVMYKAMMITIWIAALIACIDNRRYEVLFVGIIIDFGFTGIRDAIKEVQR